MSQTTTSTKTYHGGCHCGAIRIEVDLDLGAPVGRCNCTICTKRGASGAIVKPEALRVVRGEAEAGDYSFGMRTGHYHFCTRCGIHVYGRGDLPQLGGAFASVNVHCLDDVDPALLSVIYWDGRHDNWQAGARATPWPISA